MSGDERQRFCRHCQRHVHDLSAMDSDEVADLVCRNAGPLCVRFEQTVDGQVKTLDYQAAPGRRFRKNWLVVAILAALGAGGARAAWQRQQANSSNVNVVVGTIVAPVATTPATPDGSTAPAPIICP